MFQNYTSVPRVFLKRTIVVRRTIDIETEVKVDQYIGDGFYRSADLYVRPLSKAA